MKTTDVQFLEALLNFITASESWMAIAMLFAVCIAASFAIRIIRGASIKDVIGWTNGYVKEKVFLAAVKDLKDNINEHHTGEHKRMDEIAGAVKGLRTKMQEMDSTLVEVKTKVGMLEQYRDK